MFDSNSITNSTGNDFHLERVPSVPSTAFTVSAIYETFLILGSALPDSNWRASSFTLYETLADGMEESIATGGIARSSGSTIRNKPEVVDMNANNDIQLG